MCGLSDGPPLSPSRFRIGTRQSRGPSYASRALAVDLLAPSTRCRKLSSRMELRAQAAWGNVELGARPAARDQVASAGSARPNGPAYPSLRAARPAAWRQDDADRGAGRLWQDHDAGPLVRGRGAGETCGVG